METADSKIRLALQQSELFSDQDIDFLISQGYSLGKLEQNHCLFRKGDLSEKAYIIVDGVLGLYDDNDGAAQCFRRAVRGELVGEYGTLCNLARSATGIAFTDLQYFELDKQTIEQLVQSSGRFALSLVTSISRAASLGRNSIQSLAGSVVIWNPTDSVSLSSQICHDLPAILQQSAHNLTDLAKHQLITDLETEQQFHELLLNSCHEKNISFVYIVRSQELLSRRNQVLIDRLFMLVDGDQDLPSLPDPLLIAPVLTRIWPASQRKPQSKADIRRGVFSHVLNIRYSDVIHHARLGRFIYGRQNILCLGGGGARGFAHLGAISYLDELGLFNFDCIHGVSIGALISVFPAFELTPKQTFDHLENCIIKQKSYTFSFSLQSIFSLRRSRQFLDEIFSGLMLHDSWMPVKLLSARLDVYKPCHWWHGKLSDAVIASMSIPAIFPPHIDQLKGVHVDGGILCNLPVELARQETQGCVIAISLDKTIESDASQVSASSGNSNVLTTIVNSLVCGSKSVTSQNMEMADIVIEPFVGEYPFLDWSKYLEIYQRGREAAAASLEQLKRFQSLKRK